MKFSGATIHEQNDTVFWEYDVKLGKSTFPLINVQEGDLDSQLLEVPPLGTEPLSCY